MLVPLVILAGLSLFGGAINAPRFLAPVFQVDPASQAPKLTLWQQKNRRQTTEHILQAVSVGVAVLGFFLAWLLYWKSRTSQPKSPRVSAASTAPSPTSTTSTKSTTGLSSSAPRHVAQLAMEGRRPGLYRTVINDSADATAEAGGVLRRMQSGNLRSYAAWLTAGELWFWPTWSGWECTSMTALNTTILTLVTFVPLLGALILMAVPNRDRDIRWFALIVTLFEFVLSLHLAVRFRAEMLASSVRNQSSVDHQPKYSLSLGRRRHLALACPPHHVSYSALRADLVEFDSRARQGVLHSPADSRNRDDRRVVALDLFLFYAFWEATLIPMALLIGIYGHERRIYAAVKFFLFTMVASMFMLAGIIWLYAKTGSFDFATIQQAIQAGSVPGFAAAARGCSLDSSWPLPLKFHSSSAYMAARRARRSANSRLRVLAGVLLKMGTYGLIRFNVGLFPEQARRNAPWIMVLALIGIVYGALVALVQPNLKKLIAYSSVSHLGVVVLGFSASRSRAMDGAMFVNLATVSPRARCSCSREFSTNAGIPYEISEFGGLATPMPTYATLFLFMTLSSVGLPLLNGFIGEFLAFYGAFSRELCSASLRRQRLSGVRGICSGSISARSSA